MTTTPSPLRYNDALSAAAQIVARASRLLVLSTVPLEDADGNAKVPYANRGLWRNMMHIGCWRAPVQSAEPPESQWPRQRLRLDVDHRPGPAHHALAQLQRAIPATEIVTDATDLLLETAGATQVRHLHGHVPGERCDACGAIRCLRLPNNHPHRGAVGVPAVPCTCGSSPRLWTGTADSPRQAWSHALESIRRIDTMLWLADGEFDYPAAEFAHIAVVHGATLVMLSRAPSELDRLPNVRVEGAVTPSLVNLTARVRALRQA